MNLPYGETITRLRGKPVSDPYSAGTTLDWSAPVELDIDGVGVEPVRVSSTRGQNAATEDRHAVTASFNLYAETGTEIDPALDRVRVRGQVHRVVGEPADWRSPLTGWRPGIVITVERVED